MKASLPLTSTRSTQAESLYLIDEIRKKADFISEGHVFDNTRLEEPYFFKFHVQDYRGQKAAFASEAVSEGEPVFCLPFTLVHQRVNKVYLKLPEQEGPIPLFRNVHFMTFSSDYSIFLQVASFCSHACQGVNNIKFLPPRAFEKTGQVGLVAVAKRDIKPGEELSWDYGSSEYEEDAQGSFTCWCGSPQCVGDYNGAQHYPPSYIRDMLLRKEISICCLMDIADTFCEEEYSLFIENYLPQLGELNVALYFYLERLEEGLPPLAGVGAQGRNAKDVFSECVKKMI